MIDWLNTIFLRFIIWSNWPLEFQQDNVIFIRKIHHGIQCREHYSEFLYNTNVNPPFIRMTFYLNILPKEIPLETHEQPIEISRSVRATQSRQINANGAIPVSILWKANSILHLEKKREKKNSRPHSTLSRYISHWAPRHDHIDACIYSHTHM